MMMPPAIKGRARCDAAEQNAAQIRPDDAAQTLGGLIDAQQFAALVFGRVLRNQRSQNARSDAVAQRQNAARQILAPR